MQGEGSVIFDSAIALSQGLFPATTTSSTTLANGTTVTSPLGGYQYVSVASISPDDDYSVEGWTECPKFAAANTAFYSSDEFKQVASDNAAFLQSLIPIVGGRNVTRKRPQLLLNSFLIKMSSRKHVQHL